MVGVLVFLINFKNRQKSNKKNSRRMSMRKSVSILLVMVALTVIGCSTVPINDPARVSLLSENKECNHYINEALVQKKPKHYNFILSKESGSCSRYTVKMFSEQKQDVDAFMDKFYLECKANNPECQKIAIVNP